MTAMPRPLRIAIVTGTRADFGLLSPVMRAVADEPDLQLLTVVAGWHFVQDTWRDVAAGFAIDAKVRMQKPGCSGRAGDAEAAGLGVQRFAKAFDQLTPDVVMVLGDRIEALAAAVAAAVGGVRLAHIHGGDRAEGVADESMRHAVSKLAHLHFPATRTSRARLIRMGESPAVIHQSGSPAMDGLTDMKPMTDQELAAVGVTPGRRFIVLLHHPIGDVDAAESARMKRILVATKPGKGGDAFDRLVMLPNGDPGQSGIVSAIDGAGVHPLSNLQRTRFIGLLKRASVLVGNSSAGLIEASEVRSGGLPVVNIGSRQAGRERPGNVIDCGDDRQAVAGALDRAMTRPLRARGKRYGRGDTGRRIADVLAGLKLDDVPLRKQNAY